MPEVNVSLDLATLFVDSPEPDGDPADLTAVMRKAVVDRAAKMLLAGFDNEERAEMRETVKRLRGELVRERLAAEVAAAFDEPVQRTTQWGEPQGPPITVRELIRIELEAFLNGANATRNSSSHDQTPRNLKELIGTVARDTMNSTLGKTVREAKAMVDKEVQKILTEALAAKLAGVKP